MKRHWQIILAAFLIAGSTADVASACGWLRGCGRWGGGYSACSTDAYSYGGGYCSPGFDAEAFDATFYGEKATCSGGACDVEQKTDAAETSPPPTSPTCPGGSRPAGSCETTAAPTCSAETCETVGAPTCAAQTTLEREIALGLRLVEAANRSRAAKKLPPLQLDERFADGARAHSRLMAAWRSCFHRYPPTPEICAAWQTSPEAAVRAWEFSGDHKTIMHGARYTKVAPGVAYDAEGRLYWTLRIW